MIAFMAIGRHNEQPARWVAAALALLLQVLVVAGLIGAFAPMLQRAAAPAMMTAVIIAPDRLPPPPEAAPRAARAARPTGVSGAAGRRADPMAITAPRPVMAISAALVPPVAATGADVSAGARDSGSAAGAGGPGNGAGAGSSGAGGGDGKPVKIAGDINSARDYPVASRTLRIGDYVIIVVDVSSTGRPTDCRIQRPSRDPAADAITCQLAMQRFRFRAGSDAGGRPVAARYGWKQNWHY